MGQIFGSEALPRAVGARHQEVFLASDGFLRAADGRAGVSELLAGCYFFYGPDYAGLSPTHWEFLTENPKVRVSNRSGNGFDVGDKMLNLATGELWLLEFVGIVPTWVLKLTFLSGTGGQIVDYAITWTGAAGERFKRIDLDNDVTPAAPAWVGPGTETTVIVTANEAAGDTGHGHGNVQWEAGGGGRIITVYHSGENLTDAEHTYKLVFRESHVTTQSLDP